MLLIAAITSIFLGDVMDAGIIIAIVALSSVLDFSQTHKSQNAVQQLQQRVAPTATVPAIGNGRTFGEPVLFLGMSCGCQPGI
jgi:magnesium-transporting ATPase (P-type)